ncbi:MAG: hypothetical protein LBT25_11175 [Candidatus Symbiothrix sp.]|jgi:hypothetical protein|nr:hypothetical protein [Candidatus Symbiothrix sp.]
MELDKKRIELPQGTTREEMNIRKKFIKDFYAIWNATHPTKHIYNADLQDFINVRFIYSGNFTACRAFV